MSVILSTTKTIFLFVLVVGGVALFVFQTLYVHVYRFEQNSLKTESVQYHVDELAYPNIVICNRIPFTQAGLNSLGANFSQNFVLRYLREWINPSIHQDPDYVALSSDQIQQAEGVISSVFGPKYRTEMIQTIMLQCQEFVNDCKFQGTSITPFECCNMFFQPLIGTQNGGLCWLFNHNNTISQSALDLSKGLELVFSIAHNSFSNFLHKHPGIDVYLVDGNLEALRLATESFDSITLKDKQGVRLRMHKEYETDLRRFECGATSSSAKAVDSKGVNSQGSAYVLCLLQTILRVCECLPLFVSYIQYNTYIYSQFERQINGTQVCSVLQYEQCAKSYMEYVKPINWNEELSSRLGVTFRQNVDNCRRNFRPCQKTLFHGPIDYYDLPVELTQNTQDFITKLTVVYESLMVTDTIRTRSPSFYELLSYIGYNIALWFAIGHIIWSIIITPCNWFCQSNSKVGPTNLSISTVKNPSPVVTLGNPNRQQLAPIDANTSSQELFPEQI